jgi:RNA polymerase sigma factor for flagellar operon FliA
MMSLSLSEAAIEESQELLEDPITEPQADKAPTAESGPALVARLIEQYRGYVRSIAKDVSRNVASWIELDDLIGYGEIGLIQAANRFNPASGVSFKTYAYYRIRGAIYDGLREFGWLNRSQYARLKFEQGANEMVSSSLSGGRDVSGFARDLTTEANELYSTIASLIPIYIVSMDAGSRQEPAASAANSPEVLVANSELRQLVRDLIQQLSAQEAKLIEDYYYRNKTFDQIGSELGLSKSWISRLHAKIIRKLRGMLQEHGIESA